MPLNTWPRNALECWPDHCPSSGRGANKLDWWGEKAGVPFPTRLEDNASRGFLRFTENWYCLNGWLHDFNFRWLHWWGDSPRTVSYSKCHSCDLLSFFCSRALIGFWPGWFQGLLEVINYLLRKQRRKEGRRYIGRDRLSWAVATTPNLSGLKPDGGPSVTPLPTTTTTMSWCVLHSSHKKERRPWSSHICNDTKAMHYFSPQFTGHNWSYDNDQPQRAMKWYPDWCAECQRYSERNIDS